MCCIVWVCVKVMTLTVACPPGWISDSGKFPGCVACPLGTYQHKASRKICKACPINTTTPSTATISRSHCVPPTGSNSSGTLVLRKCHRDVFICLSIQTHVMLAVTPILAISLVCLALQEGPPLLLEPLT